MKTRKLATRIGGALLGIITTLAIGVALASSAQAQSTEYAQKFHDAQLIRYTDTESPFPNGAPLGRSLYAELKVTNHSSNEIKFVSWKASFIDPTTGAVIGTREITSKSRIAPGKDKTLKKLLRMPRLVDVKAVHGRTWGTIPTITTALTSVTYADGTTSRTP